VLGATSSTGRAVKAAQLFERGFGADPLSWLTPSLGTVDSLVPIAASPPDLHEDICGDHRRRHPTEEGEEGGEAGTATAAGTDDPGQRSFLMSSLRGVMGRGSAATLTSGLAAAIPPVEVYTGPARNNVAPGAPAVAAPAAKKKPGPIAIAAKPPAAKPAQTATPAAKPISPAGAAPVKPANTANGLKPGTEKAAPAAPGSKTKPAVAASPKQPLQIAPKTETQ
jgi:D-alanyl-D-alanine carboxypeptidase